MSNPNKTKLVVLCVLAGLIILAGVAGFVYHLFTGLTGLTQGIVRVQAPGRQEIQLDEPGQYTIFLEVSPGAEAQAVEYEDLLKGLHLRLETLSGQAIKLGQVRGSSTYDLEGRRGVSLMQFEITSAGRYRFLADYEKSTPARPATLTMIQGFAAKLTRVIIIGLAIMFGALLLGGLVIVLAVVLYLSGRKKQAPTPPRLVRT
ncbi:MAG: hypothetical protein AB1641_06090 [Thermodesulfobacteriota bacterium]